jgi:phytol kinase
MLKLLVVFIVVFLILVVAEYLFRVKHIRSEITRKFIHIGVGSFAAFWPFFLSWRQIELIAVLFFVGISVSRILTIFGSIHIIERRTVGELLFAVSIGLMALITHDRLIYMAALLNLSLGDGLAAILGSRYGKKHRYKVFDHTKTLTGTTIFWVCSVVILAIYFISSHSFNWPIFLGLPLLASLIENVGVNGTDNLLVPLVIVLVLR